MDEITPTYHTLIVLRTAVGMASSDLSEVRSTPSFDLTEESYLFSQSAQRPEQFFIKNLSKITEITERTGHDIPRPPASRAVTFAPQVLDQVSDFY